MSAPPTNGRAADVPGWQRVTELVAQSDQRDREQALAEALRQCLVPVFMTKEIRAWPLHERGGAADYMPLARALTKRFPTDAHFAAYQVLSVRRRLSTLAVEKVPDGVRLVVSAFDVDSKAAHEGQKPATEAWFDDERKKIAVLFAEHPGGFCFRTRGGYRLIYRLAEPRRLRNMADAHAWKLFYLRVGCYLMRRFGIEVDPACADWGRLFRLPHATRDAGGSPEDLETIGDPQAIAAWTCEPNADGAPDDVETAQVLAATAPHWKQVLRELAPETAVEGQNGHPASQSCARPGEEHLPPREIRLHRARAYLAQMPPAIQGQNGSNAALRAAIALVRGFCLPIDDAFGLLSSEYNPRCQPPWSEKELQHKVDTAEHRVAVPWAYLLADDSRQRPIGGVDTWDPPEPFDQFDLPDFPISALAPWLRDFVQGVATETQTPLDMAALLALSALSVASARRLVVRIRDSYTEPVNIFVLVIMAPGNRKSAVFSLVTEPIEKFERDECVRLAPVIAEAQEELRLLEKRIDAARTRAAKEPDETERRVLLDDVKTLNADLAARPKPVEPRYLADDVTSEKLAILMRDQGGRMAVMSAEGGVFEVMAGRYSATATPNIDVYLKGHAGDTLRVDRVGRPSDFIERPALTLGLAVQPDVLRGLTDKPGFRGRGLLGRVLYSLPGSLLGRRDVDPPRLPPAAKATYHQKLRALLDTMVQDTPHELQLSVPARDRWYDFCRELEPRLAENADLGPIADWAAKLAGAVARIAALLHIAEQAETRAPWEKPISRSTMEAAISIALYLAPHAKAAFSEMGADPAVADAKRILKWIESRAKTSFSVRELFQALKGKFRRVAELEAPLTLLEERDYIRKQARAEPQGPGRPPSQIYDVNPYVLTASQYPQNPQIGAVEPPPEQHIEDFGDYEDSRSVADEAPSADPPEFEELVI